MKTFAEKHKVQATALHEVVKNFNQSTAVQRAGGTGGLYPGLQFPVGEFVDGQSIRLQRAGAAILYGRACLCL